VVRGNKKGTVRADSALGEDSMVVADHTEVVAGLEVVPAGEEVAGT
jgi:hypothetical protein